MMRAIEDGSQPADYTGVFDDESDDDAGEGE
jgi:hypothetical protein